MIHNVHVQAKCKDTSGGQNHSRSPINNRINLAHNRFPSYRFIYSFRTGIRVGMSPYWCANIAPLSCWQRSLTAFRLPCNTEKKKSSWMRWIRDFDGESSYEASMVVSPRIKSFIRIKSARVVFPLTVGDDVFGEESAPETVIWTEEIPSQTYSHWKLTATWFSFLHRNEW